MQKRKTEIITARMTSADKKAIQQRAKAAGMTVTACPPVPSIGRSGQWHLFPVMEKPAKIGAKQAASPFRNNFRRQKQNARFEIFSTSNRALPLLMMFGGAGRMLIFAQFLSVSAKTIRRAPTVSLCYHG